MRRHRKSRRAAQHLNKNDTQALRSLLVHHLKFIGKPIILLMEVLAVKSLVHIRHTQGLCSDKLRQQF